MIEPTDEMVTAFERHGTGGYGDIVDTRAGLAAVLHIAERDLLARVEGKRGDGLCTCSDADDPPINARTGLAMEHHCDCEAVTTAAVLLGDRRKTKHVAECICDWSDP